MKVTQGVRHLALQVGVAGALLGAFYGVPKDVWNSIGAVWEKQSDSAGAGAAAGTEGKRLSVEERLAKEPTTGQLWGIEGEEDSQQHPRGRMK